MAEEKSQARNRFDQQIAHLTHPVRILPLNGLGILLTSLLAYRIQFEEEQLQLTQNRLTTLKKTQEDEETKVAELKEQKRQIQAEIAPGQEVIETLRQGLQVLDEALEKKNKVVEQVKKTHARAAKVLDQALKEIGSMAHGFHIYFHH